MNNAIRVAFIPVMVLTFLGYAYAFSAIGGQGEMGRNYTVYFSNTEKLRLVMTIVGAVIAAGILYLDLIHLRDNMSGRLESFIRFLNVALYVVAMVYLAGLTFFALASIVLNQSIYAIALVGVFLILLVPFGRFMMGPAR